MLKTILSLFFTICSLHSFSQVIRSNKNVRTHNNDFFKVYTWSYGPNLSYANSYRFINPNNSLSPYLKNVEQTALNKEEATKRVNFGLSFEYILNETHTLVSGIRFTSYGEKYKFETIDKNFQDIQYSYDYIEIPLHVKAKLTDNNLTPFVQGGLGLDLAGFTYTELSSGYYPSFSSLPKNLYYKKYQNESMNTNNISYYLGGGIEYMDEYLDTSFTLQGFIKGQLRSVYKNYLAQRQYQLGLMIGISFWK